MMTLTVVFDSGQSIRVDGRAARVIQHVTLKREQVNALGFGQLAFHFSPTSLKAQITENENVDSEFDNRESNRHANRIPTETQSQADIAQDEKASL